MQNDSTTIMPLNTSLEELNQTSGAIEYLLSRKDEVFTIAHLFQNIEHVVIVGSGESYIVAMLAASYMSQKLDICCKAWQSYEFINAWQNYNNASTLAIFITSSGRLSPVITAMNLAISSPMKTLCITNNDQIVPSLPHKPDGFIFTEAQKKGMPSQSTTLSLLALYMLSHYRNEQIPQNLYSLIHIVQPIIEKAQDFFIQNKQELKPNKTWVMLGSSYTLPLAESAANLFACGSQTEAFWYPIEEFHHSLRMFMPQSHKIFCLLNPKPEPDDFFLQTAKQLKSLGAEVIFVSPSRISPSSAELMDSKILNINLDEDGDFCPENSVISYLVFLQKLIIDLSLEAVSCGLRRASL